MILHLNPLYNLWFFSAKTKQKYKGNKDLLLSLEVIEETSTSVGLSSEHIEALVDVAASGIQGESVKTDLFAW